MKRRILFLLLIVLSLSACSKVTKENLMVNLKSASIDAESLPVNTSANIRKGLYSFYLPPHIGRKSSTVTSSILTSNNINILMNLDVIDVISDSYYDNSKTLKSMLAATENVMTFSGIFLNSKNEPVPYLVSVLELAENKIMLTLEGGYFMFVAITPIALSSDILTNMIQIARTCSVDSAAVLLSYSTRESIDYKKETLDMFNQIAPESGTILDMISGGDPIELPE